MLTSSNVSCSCGGAETSETDSTVQKGKKGRKGVFESDSPPTLSARPQLCPPTNEPQLLLTFQEWGATKDDCFLTPREKNTSMVMSDRAANCVLGDNDGSKREREQETPSWLSASLGWLAGFSKKKRKKKLVKRK